MCEVRIFDTVGVVVTPTLILDVVPKIPAPHLLYLLERGGLVPRLDAERATLASDQTLLELITRWFARELERVLEEGLARDYRSDRGYNTVARGRVLARTVV